MENTIIDFLNDYMKKADGGNAAAGADMGSDGSGRLISFHMPGHKGRSDIYEKTGYGDFLKNIVTCDITEIPGADALFCPETTLRAVMDNYADLYGVKHSELLVNGSSAGVMAAIMGTVPVGGKLILGRNSHHSAFSALRLGGINPVYVRPKMDLRSGLVGEILPADLEAACEADPDAQAVLVTSPNYYGMLSDIAALAAVAHEHGMLLIVDQAHGAHLKFFDNDAEELLGEGAHVPFPRHSAEDLGADIVINSTHKTLLSFTGSGILNICSNNVDIGAVSDALKMVQTTSPSYILMASLDINERIMRKYGSRFVKAWRDDLTTFYRRVMRIPGIEIVGGHAAAEVTEKVMRNYKPQANDQAGQTDAGKTPDSDPAIRNPMPHFLSTEPLKPQHKEADQGLDEITRGTLCPMYHSRAGLDYTKINISMAALGMSGARLDKELRQRGIISEMVHGDYVMLMTGVGNRSNDYVRLLDALKDISENYGVVDGHKTSGDYSSSSFDLEISGVPYEAESVPLYEADGRVLYDPVIIYPPGTPVACPGEILTVEVISYISDAIGRGEKVTGVDDEGLVRVELNHAK
ncbi:MAG: aminotransferase class I/II-fold pyridoxal phosphate-dependent enzyme [Mogibacterium sp.]|nr:aminotransferase class I/II-fold pyridoxal phosphate-dependent enzyme [Mogibacterium sp.]